MEPFMELSGSERLRRLTDAYQPSVSWFYGHGALVSIEVRSIRRGHTSDGFVSGRALMKVRAHYHAPLTTGLTTGLPRTAERHSAQ
jgi:hypothetical protein